VIQSIRALVAKHTYVSVLQAVPPPPLSSPNIFRAKQSQKKFLTFEGALVFHSCLAPNGLDEPMIMAV
jgi:hypothetical protein